MSLLRVGDYSGVWHNDAVKFSIQQIFPVGQFNGIGEFVGGPHNGIQFGFTGKADAGGGLSISRDVGIGIQTATDQNFEIQGDSIIWQGLTIGPGIGTSGSPFEFRARSLVRTGNYPGKWHGEPVDFNFQQIFGGGQFNGVATFTSGPHANVQFGFSGYLSGSGGVYVARNVGPGLQQAFDGYPFYDNNQVVWNALTTGVGIGAPGLPFYLCIPL